MWLAATALLVVGGLVGSLFAARSVASGDTARSRAAFKTSSGDIASTLQLAIQHENDLVVSASGFFVGNPTASNVEFARWVTSVAALTRYPELLGLGHVVVVSSADLPAFAARAVADPAGVLAANGAFVVTPPGARPYYCFAADELYRGSKPTSPAGEDYCAPGPQATGLLAVEDSGQGAYLPLQFGTTTLLEIETPVYRNGVTPPTIEGRRVAFLGWVATAVAPQIVLERALVGYPRIAVSFHYHVGTANVV